MLSAIQSIPSANYSSRDGAVPRWLILHGTAGFETAQDCAAWFARQDSKVSAHYIVGRDGTIIQCVDESMAAWAAGVITGPSGISGDQVHHDAWWDNAPRWGGLPNPNPVIIAIEHVKPSTDNSDQLTPVQQAASFALQLDICQRNNIPMRYATSTGGITGHYSMDPVNRSQCPGPYPWTALWPYLSNNGGSMIPTGWTDKNGVLTAPGGHTVTQGFRTYVLQGWDPANIPLEEAHGIANGTEQTFTQDALIWTAATGVHVAHLGEMYLNAQAQIAALQTQVTTLQKQLTAAQAAPNAQALSAISNDLKAIVANTTDALNKVTSLA